MWQKVISYKELKISLCQILYVKELNIQESINNHGTLTLTAILTNEMKAEMIHQLDEVINVYYGEGESCVSLFQGRITTISFDTEGELYRLYVTAKSYTYGMDITRKSRSFQDINMLSHTLIKSIMKDYPQSDCLLEIPNEPIGELVIQYEETDWEFIKRFVSRYGAGLFPENGFSGLRYHAGTPRENAKVSWEDRPYEIIKDIAAYRKVQSNSLKDMNPLHYVTYRVGAYDYLSLGTEVTYRGSTLYIYEISRRLEGGQLISYYDLRQKKGLREPKCYNERITGVSIDGLIIEVKRNQVKVHLEIDNNQDKGKAYWFPYSTVSASEGGSGWYCMPEIGESVRAYFPVHDEKESYVITNIKGHTPEAPQEGDYMSDPTNKNISTAQDKQVLFTPEGVFIVANSGNGQVNLKLDGSVEVSGIDDISINAVKEVKLRGDKEVSLSADKKIDILCEAEGHIQILPGGIMLLDAKEIYENPSLGGMVTTTQQSPTTSQSETNEVVNEESNTEMTLGQKLEQKWENIKQGTSDVVTNLVNDIAFSLGGEKTLDFGRLKVTLYGEGDTDYTTYTIGSGVDSDGKIKSPGLNIYPTTKYGKMQADVDGGFKPKLGVSDEQGTVVWTDSKGKTTISHRETTDKFAITNSVYVSPNDQKVGQDHSIDTRGKEYTGGPWSKVGIKVEWDTKPTPVTAPIPVQASENSFWENAQQELGKAKDWVVDSATEVYNGAVSVAHDVGDWTYEHKEEIMVVGGIVVVGGLIVATGGSGAVVVVAL